MKSILLTKLNHYKDDFRRIDALMQRGLQTDRKTGKTYFTGYSYNTLYDWDQYFEAIVQLHLGWNTSYIRNGVTIFLDNQSEDGFITRRVPGILQEERYTLDSMTQSIMAEEDKEMVKPFLSQLALLVYKKDGDLSINYGEHSLFRLMPPLSLVTVRIGLLKMLAATGEDRLGFQSIPMGCTA